MCETYEEQVSRVVDALGRERFQDLTDDLHPDSSIDRVRLFVDRNREKLVEKLRSQLEFVAGVFDDFDHWIDVYVRQHPLAAYDTGTCDAERLLLWLLDKRPLTAEQRDYVLCQRGRHAVEELARCCRAGHLAFQALRARQPADWVDGDWASVTLHVNPIRTNVTFITRALLDPKTDPPTEVLFFPVRNEIATAVLQPEELAALMKLTGAAPCTLDAWRERLKTSRGELLPLAQALVGVGLVAAEVN